jgi:dolichyl-phosphate-mannose--protein O-mannosyl transferase
MNEPAEPGGTSFSVIDIVLVLFLSMFSMASHLWLIHHPDSVVFDEVHFGNFTNGYIHSRYFFDIHPPLGKLVMFIFAAFSQYDGSIDFHARYGMPHINPDYLTLRLTPAIFSSLCSPLIYLAMRFSSFSSSASFTSGFLVACDTSLLTEHRFTLSDGMLHFFCCLYLLCYSIFQQVPSQSPNFLTGLITTGAFLGAACACKNTAWGLLLYTAFAELTTIFLEHGFAPWTVFEEAVFRGCIMFATVMATHALCFAIHILRLPYRGPGSKYLFSTTVATQLNPDLPGTQLWGFRASGWLYFQILILFASMYAGNMGIRSYHPYMSRPQNWPLLTGNYVAFWQKGDLEVVCLGNAFVYYLAFLGVLVVVLGCGRKKSLQGVKLAIGWAVSYFPFWRVPRSMYLYHYLIPLMFGCMCTGAALDIWLPDVVKGALAVFLCFLALVGFWIWSPMSYGTPHLDEDIIIWTQNWRIGDEYHRNLPRT